MEKIELKNKLTEIATIVYPEAKASEDPGLLSGKMGVAIFYAHLYLYTGKEIYLEHCYSLLPDIQRVLYRNMTSRYDKGLSGIGTGFVHLINNHIIETDADDIFEEIDANIFRAIKIMPHINFSIYRGLCGLGRYLLFRIKMENNSLARNKNIKRHIVFILDLLDYIITKKEKSYLEKDLADVYKWLSYVYAQKNEFPECEKIIVNLKDRAMVEQPVENQYEKNFLSIDTLTHPCLFNGYSGAGLYLLHLLGYKNNSYQTLL